MCSAIANAQDKLDAVDAVEGFYAPSPAPRASLLRYGDNVTVQFIVGSDVAFIRVPMAEIRGSYGGVVIRAYTQHIEMLTGGDVITHVFIDAKFNGDMSVYFKYEDADWQSARLLVK